MSKRAIEAEAFTLDGIRDKRCNCDARAHGVEQPDAKHGPDCLGLAFKAACLAAQKRALWEASVNMPVPVSRVAVELAVPKCHAKRCSDRHPSGDEILGLVDARYRDELRRRSTFLGHDLDA